MKKKLNYYSIIFLLILFNLLSAKYFDNNVESISQVTAPKIYQNGILFTYTGVGKNIFLSGSFWGFKRKVKMQKSVYGIYYYFLKEELKKGNYFYRYIIDDVWINDPMQTFVTNDNYGSLISVLKINKDLYFYNLSPKHISKNKFLFFLKDKKYKTVNIIGNFNNWNEYSNILKLDNDGYWKIKIDFNLKNIYYLFLVNNKEMLDPKNPNFMMNVNGKKINYIRNK